MDVSSGEDLRRALRFLRNQLSVGKGSDMTGKDRLRNPRGRHAIAKTALLAIRLPNWRDPVFRSFVDGEDEDIAEEKINAHRAGDVDLYVAESTLGARDELQKNLLQGECGQRVRLDSPVERELVQNRRAERVLERRLAGLGTISPPRAFAKIRLEDASSADRQEIFVNDRIGDDVAGRHRKIDILHSNPRAAVTEKGETLATQFIPIVGQRAEPFPRREQFVIQRPTLARQSDPSLLDLAEASGVTAGHRLTRD